MTKGKTEARFYGGRLDGFVDRESPTRCLRECIASASEAYFATSPDGDEVHLIRGKLNKYWFATGCDVYFKRRRQCSALGVEYQFAGKREIGRCSALTKTGTQCLNSAQEGHLYCGTSHDPAKSPVEDIANNLVMDTLREIAKNPPIERSDIPKP